MVGTFIFMPPGKLSWGEGRFHSLNVTQWGNILQFLSFLFAVMQEFRHICFFTFQTFWRWRKITHSYFVPVFGCLIAPTNYPVPAVPGEPAAIIREKLHPRGHWSKILLCSDGKLWSLMKNKLALQREAGMKLHCECWQKGWTDWRNGWRSLGNQSSWSFSTCFPIFR